MSTSWDSLLVAALARELGQRLGQARLRAYRFDHASSVFVFYMHEDTLVVRMDGSDSKIDLIGAVEPPGQALSYPGRIRRITAPPDERALLLDLNRSRGRQARHRLAIELQPQRRNVILAEGEPPVIRHVLHPRPDGERTLAPGAPYHLPSPPPRRGADGKLSWDEWCEVIDGAKGGNSLRRTLMREIAYISPLNVHAFLGPLLPGGQEGQEEVSEDGMRVAYQRWRELLDPAQWKAGLVRVGERWIAYPHPLWQEEWKPLPSIMEALKQATAAEESIDESAGAALVPSQWLESLREQVRVAQGRADQLRRQLQQVGDPEELRSAGDLILARFHEITKGAELVTLPDFDGKPKELEMDPRLGPSENAERYYDRAKKASRARERLPGLIAEAQAVLAEKRDLLQRALTGGAEPEEMAEAARHPISTSSAQRLKTTPLPYRSYRSSGGLEIRVGRGARKNDDLTFRHSSPDDIWMHARHASGAHVILRWSGTDNPPARDLEEAAVLAALHSKARTSGSVPVDWTRRKYVRKPRKAPPGTVVPERVSTLFVEPDEEVEARLKPTP